MNSGWSAAYFTTLLAGLVGCNSQGKSAITPGPAVEVGAAGGKVASAPLGVEVDIPAGALAGARMITIARATAAPPSLPEPLRGRVRVGPVYDLGPSGTKFTAPVVVTVKVPDDLLRASANEDVWLEVGTFEDGAWRPVTMLPPTQDGMVRFETDHFSLFWFAAGAVAIGGAATYGLMEWADTWQNRDKLITPGAIPRSHLDKINLPATINAPVNLNQLGFNSFEPRAGRLFGWRPRIFPANGGTMVTQPDANCWDATNYVGSVLMAKNDPRFTDFKAVSGKMTNRAGETGDHAWIEIRIDGKLYVVDTSRPNKLELLTKEDAYTRWKLQPMTEWTSAPNSKRPYAKWPGEGGGSLHVTVAAAGKDDGRATVGGGATFDANVDPGTTLPLEFKAWGKRREYCVKSVMTVSTGMKEVELFSHGETGCSFGTRDGTMRAEWQVTEEKIVWAGPGVSAGAGSMKLDYQVPAEPGTYTVTATDTVQWSYERNGHGTVVRDQATESGAGTFTITVGPPR